MNVTKRLVMTFLTDGDRKVSLSVDYPREDVTEAEIKACMELVVSKNIFAPKGESIVKSVDARVVVTDTTDYDLVL